MYQNSPWFIRLGEVLCLNFRFHIHRMFQVDSTAKSKQHFSLMGCEECAIRGSNDCTAIVAAVHLSPRKKMKFQLVDVVSMETYIVVLTVYV